MEFVKRSVYQQEFTEAGAKESELDARDDKQKQDDLLKNLPEFRTDIGFRSLAEQLDDNRRAAAEDGTEVVRDSDFAPAARTEEEYEFLTAIEAQKNRDHELVRKDEEGQLAEFRSAQMKFESSLKVSPSRGATGVQGGSSQGESNAPHPQPNERKRKSCSTEAVASAAILVRKRRAESPHDTHPPPMGETRQGGARCSEVDQPPSSPMRTDTSISTPKTESGVTQGTHTMKSANLEQHQHHDDPPSSPDETDTALDDKNEKERGTGSKERGTGSKERGTGSKERGTGSKDSETDVARSVEMTESAPQQGKVNNKGGPVSVLGVLAGTGTGIGSGLLGSSYDDEDDNDGQQQGQRCDGSGSDAEGDDDGVKLQ